ncbi:MAG: RusA family crossover junction endodeoxyribonuclease, partial [Spirulinaceae cyanobacterium SM2_1_0]|nr:RusA family crossover junction endodeoxyribonuclease [Spirulinaceae cyanobacterium SM2_1_0]
RDEIAAQQVILPPAPWLWFLLPMPTSWSVRKKAANCNKRHQKRPDLDNLVKALLDSVFRDSSDAHVWDIRATKLWAKTGAIVIADANASGRQEIWRFLGEQAGKE